MSIVISVDKDDNKDDSEILLRIKGADLRRLDKYKKRLHLNLTTAHPNGKIERNAR